MLKKKALNRIFITTIALCIVMVIYTFTKIDTDIKIYDDYIYINNDNKQAIYTLNEENLIGKSKVYLDKSKSLEEQVIDILQIMIEKNNKNSLLPSYLKPILPQNTKILSVSLVNDILKINFSKELNNIKEEQSEQMIEAITYTLNEFKDVLGVEISVEGNILKYVPNQQKTLPTILTDEIGINKLLDINNVNNIEKVILYYYGKKDDEIYDIPVTKYLNDDKEKIEIILDCLTTNIPQNKKVISYLNQKTKLLNYIKNENILTINLNDEIYDDKTTKEYNSLAIESLVNSVFANYDIKTLRILVNDNKLLERTNQ